MLDNCENLMGTPLPSSSIKNPNFGSSNSISPFFSSPLRLWRPAAQRNIKNQWSKLLLCKDLWFSTTSEGRLHATELVNAYLKWRYLPEMKMGALEGIPGIRKKACDKLAIKQDLYRSKLISSYKHMVVVVNDLGKASRSMKCYLKGSGSNPIIQYSDHQEDPNDLGDAGGIPVFFWISVSLFEDLARELVNMFIKELSLKRFLVIGLLSINGIEDGGEDILDWSNELYHGEFDDLRAIGMFKQDSCHADQPQIMDYESSDPLNRTTIKSPNHNTFEVYLTTWISDLNINMHRVKEIFSVVQEEIRSKLS